jgi:hypothetical protein
MKRPAVEAMRLLGKWQRISAGHVMLAGGCSCGAGFGALPVQRFEQDILAYLYGRHGSRAAASVAELLAGVARQVEKKHSATELALLADLERSIDSFH